MNDNSIKKILILASNPKGTSVLDLDREIRNIREGLRRSENREQFQIEQRGATRVEDLRQGLLETKPTIVHFCGHGSGEQGLLLEDNSGEPYFASTEALSGLFEITADPNAHIPISCVLLNACYSEIQAKAIVQHVNYVIGMQKEIRDDLAIAFTQGFYDGLGAGQSIELAYQLGCNAIQFENSNKSASDRKFIPIDAPESTQKTAISEHLIPILLKKEQFQPFSPEATALISQSAGKGLYALKDLMSNPQVYAEVKAGKEKLQEACNQIKIISTYKDVHDQLHTLEFECYQAIIREVQNFCTDPEMALDNLLSYESNLQRINGTLPSLAQREVEGTPILKETDWFEDLKQAQVELHESIETADVRKLKTSVYLLNSVLAYQPTVMDTNLKNAADALCLPTLIKHMNNIREKLTQVDSASEGESRKIQDFQEGVDALEDLQHKLEFFIVRHNSWQKIELELRRIHSELNSNTQDITPLEMSWSGLKKKLEKQCNDCEDDWARELQKIGDDLDRILTVQVLDLKKIKRSFQTYRGRASNHFFIVDKELMEFCGQLRDHIDNPLASIMEMMAS